VLESNLACLQDCAAEDRTFRRDAEKLQILRRDLDGDAPGVLRTNQTDKTSTP
jgi:hypothetical protein